MVYFCNKCMCTHSEDELCPRIKQQIKNNPELLSQAATFTNVAGQYRLVSSQDLQTVASKVNQFLGTNLKYDGTHQFARDIQVFDRLNTEAFKNVGYFSNSESAKQYLEFANQNPNHLKNLHNQLIGSGQEIDWLRFKHGQISNILEKSNLLNGNAPGVDGVTVNRINNEVISRMTAKGTTCNPKTGINQVLEAIEKGNATKDDIIFGVKGTKEAARTAGLDNPVIEKNTMQKVKESNERLKEKMGLGQATTTITTEQLMHKMAHGAIVGAIVSLTITSITSYIKYRNGELTIEEAFTEIAEDTTKGAIIGGGMAGITLFLPAGALGFCSGLAIGIYLNSSLKNVLDETFGKGAYKEIFISNGYIMGTSMNLTEALQQFKNGREIINACKKEIIVQQQQTKNNFNEFDKIMGVIK